MRIITTLGEGQTCTRDPITNVRTCVTTRLSEHQRVYPRVLLDDGVTHVAADASFTPGAPFGWVIRAEWSDDTRNATGGDADHGCDAAAGVCGHHMRFYPVRDSDGRLRANTWLVGSENLGANFDYQDTLLIVTNMRPASG